MPDLVAIDLPGGPAFVEVLKRSWDRGDAVLPVDQRLSGTAKAAILRELKPTLIEGPSGTSAYPGGEGTEPGDALVVATSGTTGTAKGVILTHDAVAASAFATSSRLEVDPSRHRWLACLPLNHVGGLSVLTRSIVTGTPCIVLARYQADEVLDHSGPDVLVSLVATALRRVDAPRFRTVVLGGSAPPSHLPPNVVTTYGLTETGSGVVYDGVPLDGVEVRIDPETPETPETPGTPGTSEIQIRAPMLLRGYRDGTNPVDPGGWFRTGDAGWIDAEARLHVDGRLQDMIVTGGENVWPEPVEAAIRADPAVREVAVAGAPDAEWGHRVVAWVVPSDPASPPDLAALRARVAESVAPYASPKQLILVEALPRTAIGKVIRDRLLRSL